MRDRDLMQEFRRRNEELSTLVEIGKALTSTLHLEELLNVIMEKVGLLLKSRNWSLALVDESAAELVFAIAVSPTGDLLKGMRLAMGEGIAGWVAAQGEPLLLADVQADSRFAGRLDGISVLLPHSVLAVPMRSRNLVLGVMELVNSAADEPFTEDGSAHPHHHCRLRCHRHRERPELRKNPADDDYR